MISGFRKYFKLADVILALALILMGFAFSFAMAAGRTDGEKVQVIVDGEIFGVYSLKEDQTVDIKQGKHLNRLEIKDGSVCMVRADCHGQDCIQQGHIHQTGENIVCLPNKVVIEIIGGSSEYDTISR